jgi:hypothetical protein
MLAVDHHDEARFLAVEEFLDHDARARIAELVARQHHVDCRVRLFQRHRDDHALAGREAVGLDDDRRALGVEVGVRGGCIGEGLVVGGRNAVALHERLREILRAFELRGFAGRAEHLQAARAEQVDDAGRERRFRPTSVNATPSLSAKSASASSDVMSTFFRRSSCAVPPLPGAT